MQGDELHSFQYPRASSPRDEPSTTCSSVLRLERIRSRSTRCRRPDRRDVVSRPVRVAQKDSLLGSKQGDPWVPGTSQGPMGFRGKGGVVIHRSSSITWPALTDRRTRGPSQLRPIHKCCGSSRRGIATRPVWTAPTGTPLGSALAANRDLHRPLAAKRNPPGFLGKGDVMIHRPCLVAWPVGSDWRTRRPRQCPSIH